MEDWAIKGGANLEKGWKAGLSKHVKRALLDGLMVTAETITIWQKVFEHFQSGGLAWRDHITNSTSTPRVIKCFGRKMRATP